MPRVWRERDRGGMGVRLPRGQEKGVARRASRLTATLLQHFWGLLLNFLILPPVDGKNAPPATADFMRTGNRPSEWAGETRPLEKWEKILLF